MTRPLVLVLQLVALYNIAVGAASSDWVQFTIGLCIAVLSVAGRKKAGR